MAAPEGYKALGKIGISYKGDYNPNTVYERLDAVYHNGSTYLAIKDAPDGAPRNDKINWIYLAKGYDGETVDVSDSEIAFTDSETRENIVSGEKVSTVFGKIKKFFTDLTAPAFAQMITTKEDLLATKVTGYVPDAKAVADAYTELNGNLPKEWKLISTVTTLSAIGSGKGLTIPDLSSYKELLILTTLSYFETSETYPIINGHINGTGYARPGCYLGSSNWQTCTIYISDAEINVVDYVKNGTAQTSGFFVTFYIR